MDNSTWKIVNLLNKIAFKVVKALTVDRSTINYIIVGCKLCICINYIRKINFICIIFIYLILL